MRSYDSFLHLFIYYMCSRCEVAAPGHDRQPDDGSGRHAHNGEMLDRLDPVEPTVDRLFSAYIGYCSVGDGPSTLTAIANGYNRTVAQEQIHRRVKQLGDTPVYTALKRFEQSPGVWLRHGIEHTVHAQYHEDAVFPPAISRYSVGTLTLDDAYQQGYFAVDLDTLPFTGCSVHSVDSECGMPWAFVAGYIPLAWFAQNGELYNPPDRDHYYAKATTPIPAQQWTYVYTDIPKRAVERRHQQAALQQLRDSGLSCISYATLQQHHRLIQLLHIHAQTRPLVKPYKPHSG